jgi:peptidyl-prolyl cis-trans isomerase SurA
MPDFGTGKFDPVFESAIYNLAKDGDYSQPFTTAYGYHIVKRMGREPVGSNRNDQGVIQQISEMVRNDSRNEKVKEVFVKTIMSKIGYREAPVNRAKLLLLTDSAMAGIMVKDKLITEKTTLHQFQKQTVKVGDFWQFAREARSNNQFKGKNSEGLLKEYVKATAMEYYRDHLEEYDAAFKNQVMEFKDGNLLFEAMEKNIWNKSAQDTVGLLKYYNENKQKYKWEASADAIVFTAANKQTADELAAKAKANPTAWRDSALLYNELVQADSNRYVLADLPAPENTRFANGLWTTPIPAGSEGAMVFSYIIKTHPAGQQRSFEEARGFVINDYQHLLEEKWIADLKRKYPVTVNQKAWQQIINGK